jgi:hypothetical protein
MSRKILLPLIMLATPALGGCALQAAMMAAELAPQLHGPMGPKNAHLKPQAVRECTQQAAQYGSVYIVDVEQRRADRIIVWGSVTDARQQRRTFECHFTTRLGQFKLGEVLPPT